MSILKIKDNTYCFKVKSSLIPFYKINDRDIIMLDTGFKEERDDIENELKKNSLKVSGIINSHAHIDHIGNNSYFKEKYDCIIAMPAYEAFICSSEMNLKLYYRNETMRFIKKYFKHMVCKTDFIIKESEDMIILCKIPFKILHTPGHSPSHICITTPDNVSYLGDAVISDDLMKNFKIPYSYILSEDMKSKAKLYDLKSDRYVVAHKGVYDDITNLIDKNIDYYEKKAFDIYSVINKPMTIEEVLKAVSEKFFIRLDDVNRYNLIKRMIKSYLDYLYEIQRIKIINEDGIFKFSI
ncbi:MBL fold metallo-hydrolase [Clostridium sp. BJN0001]|uniref:MBL fold metallo-hydrolase n=1 Tax=Clostridium sp. BJN0001 TaxID=2930219 RepID=UPI001FD3021B|nr:MBL fold metallo-hydrolase [Clostridium sp. BJN0001]